MEFEQFHRYADGWPEAMLLVSGSGVVLAANTAASKLLGLKAETLAGLGLAELIDDIEHKIPQCLKVWRASPHLFQVFFHWRLSGGASAECTTQGFLLKASDSAAEAQILLRCSPGNINPGNFRLLNRQIDNQRKTMQRMRKRSEALETEQTRALVTLNSIRDAVITTDQDGIIEWLNPMAEMLTGWTSREALRRPLQEVFNIVDESSGELVVGAVARCLQEDRVIKLLGHTQLISRDGTEYVVEVSSTPLHTEEAEVFGAVIIFRDVTSAHLDRRQLEYLTQYDMLTGLFNRQHFEQQVEQVLCRSKRSGETHGVLSIDVDNFRQLNGAEGHQAADEVLAAVAECFERRLRGGDILARLGGDQFGVLLMGVDTEQANRAAEAFRSSLEGFDLSIGDEEFPVRVSIGIAMISADTESPDVVMKAADVACSEAKQAGGNRCRMSAKDAALSGEDRLSAEIKKALEGEAFELHFQPLMRASDSAVVSYEALLRLCAGDGSALLPSVFIPVAERHGLMPAVDRWVVNKALRTLREAPTWAPDLSLTVNLSAASLAHADTPGFIRDALMRYGVAPERLVLEVTEAHLTANAESVTAFVESVKALGCRVTLDDFGGGLDGLSRIKSLPVDFLKINAGRLGDLGDDPVAQSALAALVQMARAMGRETILAQVESSTIVRQLARLGVDHAQGYGVGRPLPRLAEAA